MDDYAPNDYSFLFVKKNVCIGEEFEMLVSFAPEHYSEVMQIAQETNTLLTVYAKVAKNNARYKCKSHHFQ